MGLILVLLIATGGRPGVDRAPASAAKAFLAEWVQSRSSTWVVESRFTRHTAAGSPFSFDIHNAQRPPDRLLMGQGSVVARRGDQLLACAGRDRSRLHCRTSGGAASWPAELAGEVHVLESYFEGDPPLYQVRRDQRGCFALTQVRPLLSAPYGFRARFCFDPRTHAPTLAQVERAEGVDVTRAVSVRGHVTDADLAPPPSS